MKKLASTIGRSLLHLYRNENGAETIEYILIVAAIALPLLLLLLLYGKDLSVWLQAKWNEVKGGSSGGGFTPP